MTDVTPEITDIRLLQKQRILELSFVGDGTFQLSCEYLRVFSPSADVRGHAGEEGELVLDKQDVNISGIEPVGNYAIRLIFDDGHQTGIYSWQWLYDLAQRQEELWQQYLQRVAQRQST